MPEPLPQFVEGILAYEDHRLILRWEKQAVEVRLAPGQADVPLGKLDSWILGERWTYRPTVELDRPPDTTPGLPLDGEEQDFVHLTATQRDDRETLQRLLRDGKVRQSTERSEVDALLEPFGCSVGSGITLDDVDRLPGVVRRQFFGMSLILPDSGFTPRDLESHWVERHSKQFRGLGEAGTVHVEAGLLTLDLHGYTIRTAVEASMTFVDQAWAHGEHRVRLVHGARRLSVSDALPPSDPARSGTIKEGIWNALWRSTIPHALATTRRGFLSPHEDERVAVVVHLEAMNGPLLPQPMPGPFALLEHTPDLHHDD